jgi:hypothetical protein
MARRLSLNPSDVKLRTLGVLWQRGPRPVRAVSPRLDALAIQVAERAA